MSMENVRKFYEALKTNPAMAEELNDASAELNRRVAQEAFERIAEFARSNGYDITADDLKEYETQAQELSAEELEEVNAGRSFCIAIGLGWGDTNYSFCRVLGLGLCG